VISLGDSICPTKSVGVLRSDFLSKSEFNFELGEVFMAEPGIGATKVFCVGPNHFHLASALVDFR
jgi:hypothetical protein